MKKTYEEICEILDEKLAIIEDENTPLFDLVDAYKDGMKLINEARDLLDKASKDIEEFEQNKSSSISIDTERLPF
ncbi:exodeoxyribonuclease VII small subunit [Campylobacter sp. Cr9]|uniref:exodeoxyribonuclease VII small subunit n=1 Tax=unclassified Campylobacter TaxID=2593542 RepID=UPI001EFAD7D5|nr:exodeoxyribonuclease VII small subunit [Campylobacter sp. RM5004]MBZ7984949.1 exodeoxyribonuclease VII small subunit [Campylobacter sp. Cr9]ULO02234.1 exodeoxyribonuclease VII, small subunit [Campylobacter sp. RM5004]